MDIEYQSIINEPLYKFLSNFLILFLPKNDIDILLSVNSYRTFKKAFTHSSINNINNYEVLELLGDAKLKSAFLQYLYEKEPSTTSPEIFTTIYTYFLSKTVLSKLSDQLNFTSYIISKSDMTSSIKEDVFESFIGALFINTNLYIQKGLGDTYVYLFVVYIFNKQNISIKNYYQYTSYITILKEIYDNQGWGKVNYQHKNLPKTSKKSNFYVVVIHNKNIIGTGYGNNLKSGKEIASKSSIKYLLDNKIIDINNYPNLSFINDK
jgi:dsRNA-specific ribonuclease